MRGDTVKINHKILSILANLFGTLTISLAFLSLSIYANNDNMKIFMGITALITGLIRVNMEQQINSKGIITGNKQVGIFYVIASIAIIIGVLFFKMMAL